VAFATITAELRPHLDITVMHYPDHFLHHMIANGAHPQTIQRFLRLHLPFDHRHTVTYLPVHSQQRAIFTYIYRQRPMIDYV